MIDVKNLSKSFGDHLVLNDISQHIHPGEKVVVIGPSGSGKSTFLRCLNLLETPTSGTITFQGTVITDPKVKIDQVRQQMGMVFQHFNLFPNMTIRKNITLAPVRTGLMRQEEADAQADALLLQIVHDLPGTLHRGLHLFVVAVSKIKVIIRLEPFLDQGLHRLHLCQDHTLAVRASPSPDEAFRNLSGIRRIGPFGMISLRNHILMPH